MHEWALAESVIASIRREMEHHQGAELRAVNLVFGELQNIDREIFRMGMEELFSEIEIGGEILHIETEPARFHCNACSSEWGLSASGELSEEEREAIHFLPEAAHAFLHCPQCGSRDYQVTAGRGVMLSSIELAEPEASGGT